MVQVVAGARHSGCVTEDSSVYMSGDNEQGQLAQDDVFEANLPVLALDAHANVKSE